jgi:hypothetical protein
MANRVLQKTSYVCKIKQNSHASKLQEDLAEESTPQLTSLIPTP